MSYLLDANVFIQAKNLHYGLDFCPAFWEWLIERNAEGTVSSIAKVEDELLAGADDLETWTRGPGKPLFVDAGAEDVGSFQEVSRWIGEQAYEPAAVNTFLQVADYYLVAQALTGEHVVVTHEVVSTSVKRIKIPNVCLGLGIRCITPYAMLRLEKARFVLGSPANAGGPG